MGNRRSYDNVYVINDYGGREAVRMSNDILTSILEYSDSIVDEAHDIANDIQEKMLQKIVDVTPVRKYSTHTQVISRIIVHRSENVPKAVKEKKLDKYQPGVTKQSWKRLTTNNLGSNTYSLLQSSIGSNIRSSRAKTRTVYAIRNTTRWSIIHLINFDHNLLSHGAYRGTVHGTHFVDEVQDWGQKELDRRLREYLDER